MYVTIVSYNKQKLTTQKAAASIPPYFPKLLSHIRGSMPLSISWVFISRRGVYPHPCREQPCSIHIASSDKGSTPSKPTRHVTSALRFIVKCSLEQRAVVIYP